MFRIRISNDQYQTFRSTIGGLSVTFTVRWNDLDETWYMSLSVGTVALLQGIRMVAGPDLLYGQGVLGGTMWVRPLQADDESEVGLGGWGATHELVYREAAA